MPGLKIQNIQKAIDTFDLIKWLNYNFQVDSRELEIIYDNLKDDKPEIIIFTHWITYINDRMKKVSLNLWKKWVNFFGYIIKKYITEINEFNDYSEFKLQIEEIRDSIEPNLKVKQIYPQDWANIVYTLWILGKFYKKSIIDFLDKVFSTLSSIEMEQNESELLFLEFFMYLLSYSASDKQGNSKTIQKNLSSFFENLKNIGTDRDNLFFSYRNLNWKKWLSDRRYNSKRLMACLRDLIRAKFFINKFDLVKKSSSKDYPYLFSNKGNDWFSLDLNDLELPGDRWNIRFDLPAILKVCSFKIKRYDNVSRMTREIYETIKSISFEYAVLKSEQEFEYYPIDMDFTFWFVPKYCEKNECLKCPFGPNGFECEFSSKMCSFYENEKIKCIGRKNCPIFNKKGMGMCGLSF